VNFENLGHTTKNKTFRLVKLLADLSTILYCKLYSFSSCRDHSVHTYKRT